MRNCLSSFPCFRPSVNPEIVHRKALEKGNSGDFENAKLLYEESIKLYEKKPENASLARVYSDFASLHFTKGNHDEAIKYYKESLSSFEKDGFSDHDQARVNLKIASCYYENNQYDQACSHISKSLEIANNRISVVNERFFVDIFGDAGNLYLKMNFDDKGIDCLKKSIKNSYKILLKEESKRIDKIDDPNIQDLNNFVSNSINFMKILQKNHMHSLGHKEYFDDILKDFEEFSEPCNTSKITKGAVFAIFYKLSPLIDGDIGNPLPKVEPRPEGSVNSPRFLYDTGAGVYIGKGSENLVKDKSDFKDISSSLENVPPSPSVFRSTYGEIVFLGKGIG